MGMVLTDDQNMLRDSARAFIRERMPISELRRLRDGKDADGFSRVHWKQMADMGWAGAAIPEEHGGLGFGFHGLCLVLEEAGYTLAASPLVSTVLVGAHTVLLGGNDGQKADILPNVAAGNLLLAPAIDEGPHHDPRGTATKAEKGLSGYKISGRKIFVLDGHVADKLVVAARTSGKPGEKAGVTLFLVDADAPGVSRARTGMVDSRNAAVVTFDGVKVNGNSVLGQPGDGLKLLEQVLDRACIGLAAEMLGSAQGAFDMTLTYLKERTQFGQTIGRFQALQHRAAAMFAELELLRSVVLEAATAVEENADNVPLLASLAKARACGAFHLIAREGIQMHGGIGMTDEHDIGLYLKRCAVAETTFGGAAYHRDRYAGLEGF